jgi:hypothetical protein
MARPSKLTAELQERIVTAIRAGNYPEAACVAAGISLSTHYRWMARGQTEEPGPYTDYRAAVIQAEAEGEVHAVAIVRRAMAEDWRAALAYLERRHPARWRRQQTTELVGKDGGPIRTARTSGIDLSKLSDDELALLEQLQERAAIEE